jgi:hypothetical protein
MSLFVIPQGSAVAFAVACPFVCHSAAKRRNLLLPGPQQIRQQATPK